MSVIQSKTYAHDLVKSGLYAAMRDYFAMNDCSCKVILAVNPTNVYAADDIEKGGLVLAPCVPLASILIARDHAGALQTGVSIFVGPEEHHAFIIKPAQPTSPWGHECWKKSTVVPFFWIAKAIGAITNHVFMHNPHVVHASVGMHGVHNTCVLTCRVCMCA